MRLLRIIVLFLALTSLALSHADNYYFRTVDVKNGLADNFVRNIFKDSNGYIWVSTINGLSQYDGYLFQNYTPQLFGSRTNDVSFVGETADSTLWMVCASELFSFNATLHRWNKDGTSKLTQLGIKGRISVFYIDDRHNLWVATDSGLYFYDYVTHVLTHFYNYSTTKIAHIASRKGVTIVVTDDFKVLEVALKEKKLLPITQAPNMPLVRDVRTYIDSHMNLWIYHSHSLAGTQHLFSLKSHQWIQMKEWTQMGQASVNMIIEDHEGKLWVGTNNEGLFVFEYENDIPAKKVLKNDVFQSNNSHISCLFLDEDNTLWIGSAKLGVAFTDMNAPNLNLVSTTPFEDVSALVQDHKGNIWIGFDGDGIVRQDTNGNRTHYSESDHQLPSNIITSLLLTSDNNIIAGSYGKGLAKFNGNRFSLLYPDYAPLKYVKAITSDKSGNLWVATVDNGVIKITADGHFTCYTSENSKLISNGIICITYDSLHDIIYIGTSMGVSAYDCKNEQFINSKQLAQLNGTYVSSMLICPDSHLWIGSRNGVWVYRSKKEELDHLTNEQGLSHNSVRALARTKNGVWVSTDNGLTFISHNALNNGHRQYWCYPLFDPDGLHNIIFSNNAALTTPEENVLMGCFAGFISIGADDIVTYYPKLQIQFTNFRINGENIQRRTLPLTIKYGERLGIYISAMAPALSHKIRYFYRFKDDKTWISAPNNMLYFATLTPGMHTLEVKAVLTGIMESEVAVLPIKVQPPLWLTFPAILLYILLFIGVVYLIYRFMRIQQQRKMAVRQLEMNLKKYELEEEKIRFFTNISHDIKTPLTLILAPLEKTLGNNLSAPVRTELNVAWRNARQLYDLVLQLLDFRRLDVGMETLNLKHGDIVSFVRQVVQDLAYYASKKNIDILLNLPSNAIEIDFDEQKMRRIITNIMSNAFKYSNEHGTVNVTLNTQPNFASSSNIEHNAQMTLSIADTGIGIINKRHIFERYIQESHGQQQEGTGIGLHIVKQYVNMMGGNVTVTDNKPKGSVFTVTLPVKISTNTSVVHLQTAESDEQPSSTINAPTEESTLKNQETTILVVEDNTDARQFLQRSLCDEYHVQTANNGKEALRILEETEVTLIISDVMMPVMDGIELFRHIKRNIKYSHIPVILLTAKSSEENIVEGLKEGVSDYITKPFSLEVLKLRIHKILEWTKHIHSNVEKGIDINPSEITVSSLDEELISHVIAKIEANISDINYSVAQLSSDIGMTRGHLYKKLMTITGKSPMEFMRIMKIKRGRSLLEQGISNVSEVADMVGLSPKQFSHYFKMMYDDTPSEFLRKNKNLPRTT